MVEQNTLDQVSASADLLVVDNRLHPERMYPPSSASVDSKNSSAIVRSHNAILPSPANSTGAPAAGRFAVNGDGAGTYTYPIWVHDGRRNLKPTLSIAYSSRDEDGLLGLAGICSGSP